mgnify:CR=1 FL=1
MRAYEALILEFKGTAGHAQCGAIAAYELVDSRYGPERRLRWRFPVQLNPLPR